ncbi:hypothetical protein HK102_013567, partial [Quaeritorhiza haematococci]
GQQGNSPATRHLSIPSAASMAAAAAAAASSSPGMASSSSNGIPSPRGSPSANNNYRFSVPPPSNLGSMAGSADGLNHRHSMINGLGGHSLSAPNIAEANGQSGMFEGGNRPVADRTQTVAELKERLARMKMSMSHTANNY